MNVTACAWPLYVAVVVERKFEPCIVRVCVGEPAITEEGEMLAMLGMRLEEGGG